MSRQQSGRVPDGVQWNSNGADEVQGNSNGADGVQGRSDGVGGVQGSSNGADGVQGSSNGADGVQGNSNGADGVLGSSNGADGAPPGARRLRLIGAELGRKMRAGMSSMSFKVKELFQGPNPYAIYKLVEDATSETLDDPDWDLNHDICDMLNHQKVKAVDLLHGIRRRMMLKSPRVHRLSLLLLQTILNKCNEAFSESEVAAEIESVLDEIFKLTFDKLVEDATSEVLDEPDWDLNLYICDIFNRENVNNVAFIRGIKRRMMLKSPGVQYLSLVLLETLVKNCDKAFSEVAAESVLDEMVKLIDDPQTVVNNRNKALMLIEAWGESTAELRYLPVYEETYKSLKSRGIRFPGRDNESLAPIFTPARSDSAPEVDASLAQQFQHDVQLEHDIPVQRFSAEQMKEAFDMARNCIELLSTVLSSSPQQDALEDDLITTLAQQCRESQSTVVRIIESAGDNESLLFEALNVNDEIQKALSKYEELKPPHASPGGSNDDMMDDLFEKKGAGSSEGAPDSER